jgi:SulP family sulfate permease
VVVQVVAADDLKADLAALGLQAIPKGVMIYEIDGPFFFGAVEKFEHVLMEIHADPQVVILRFRRVPFMDITGIQTLEEVIVKLRKRGVRTMLCEVNDRVRAKLWKAGVIELLGSHDFEEQFAKALASAVKGLTVSDDGSSDAKPAA